MFVHMYVFDFMDSLKSPIPSEGCVHSSSASHSVCLFLLLDF